MLSGGDEGSGLEGSVFEGVGWPELDPGILVLDGSEPMEVAAPRVRRFLEECLATGRAAESTSMASHPGPQRECWLVIGISGEGDLWMAIEPERLLWHADNPDRPMEHSIADHLGLDPREASVVVRGEPQPDRIAIPPGDRWSPGAFRAIHLDDAGVPVTVGQWGMRSSAPPPMEEMEEAGASRGAPPGGDLETSAPPPADDAPPPTFQATLSAQGPEALAPGETEFIEVRIERDGDGSLPLAKAVAGVEVLEAEPIQVMLSVRGRGLRVLGSRRIDLAPPAPGRASLGEFEVEAMEEGEVQVGVSFRQVGSELGAVRLSVRVTRDVAGDVSGDVSGDAGGLAGAGATPELGAQHRPPLTREMVEALPREPGDDAILRLLIDEMEEDSRTFYRYRLVSEPLGFHYLTMDSQPLLDRDGGAAKKLDQYVARIHENLTRRLRRSDLPQFQVELEAAGISLCHELLSPDVARVLWPLRGRIQGVQITSWEPRIPWELVRLKDPDSGEVDDRYLAEYGLVRTFHGRTPPREFAMARWKFLAATYPHNTERSVLTEVGFITRELPAEGVEPERIEAGFEPLWTTITAGDFDVLHLACHGLADPGNIQTAALLIGDQPGESDEDPPKPIRIESESVRFSNALWNRRPLVFLHACEAGRHGLGLTEWGGWPTAFMEAGAGAFVGASWPVRDQPAEVFATTFYQALWSGATLSEAAQGAREAGKAQGDASWLAFKVYGHPRARRVVPPTAPPPRPPGDAPGDNSGRATEP